MFSPGINDIHGFKIKSTEKYACGGITFIPWNKYFFPTYFTFRSRIEHFLLTITMIKNILFLIIVNVTVYFCTVICLLNRVSLL